MPKNYTMSSFLFPPETREIQLDEMWSFVGKNKQKAKYNRSKQSDRWEMTAYDPEHRLVLSVVSDKRYIENIRKLLNDTKNRIDVNTVRLLMSDEFGAYSTEIIKIFGIYKKVKRRYKVGQPPKPKLFLPDNMVYATVHKTRKNNAIVKVENILIYGTEEKLAENLELSTVSNSINTSFIERYYGTNRHRNARRNRKTYRHSKDIEINDSMAYFVNYSYNFCWCVRTLREEITEKKMQKADIKKNSQRKLKNNEKKYKYKTPAMAANLTDHVWTIKEWLLYPAIESF